MMCTDRDIRAWYRASRSGTRGDFLQDVRSLTSDILIALLKKEIASATEGRVRTRAELERLSRAKCPDVETLKAQSPKEQTIQWLFMHRNHLSTVYETVLRRELPSSYRSDRHVEGRADLIAFDRALGQPILVELKCESATDPLSGAILELLYHWSFHMRHKSAFDALLIEEGCKPALPCKLMLIAPEAFYSEARRRSCARHGEFERAMSWIEGLAASNLVTIGLYSLDPDWQQQGPGFVIQRYVDGP